MFRGGGKRSRDAKDLRGYRFHFFANAGDRESPSTSTSAAAGTILKARGMTFSPEPVAVRFDEYGFWVDLEDGRTLGIPLAWFSRLLHATPERAQG